MRSARAPSGGPAGVDGAVFDGVFAGDELIVVGFFVGADITGGKVVGGWGFAGAGADDGLIGLFVGDATTGGKTVGIALVGGGGFAGAAVDGGLIGFFVGAATMGGKMVCVSLVVGGGFGGAAAAGALVGALVLRGIIFGTRTDFLHRLQSNIFTGDLASRTSGAEQCGQSKRISLPAVPVFNAPPFCIVGNGSSDYTNDCCEPAWRAE